VRFNYKVNFNVHEEAAYDNCLKCAFVLGKNNCIREDHRMCRYGIGGYYSLIKISECTDLLFEDEDEDEAG
jgi:hypothetical protein